MAPGMTAPGDAAGAAPRGAAGVRFTRFAAASLAALTTSEATLALCDGGLHLAATPAAVSSWFTGAAVSYLFTRRAWERTGRPDLLRETVPFWIISAAVVVVLTVSAKAGYAAAAWLHLHGAMHVAFVGLAYLAANLGTFLARFMIFHHLLFAPGAARPGAARARAARWR
jgi:putative flippase GtrA